ncbi:MAG: discoidin domain-containing protein [Clostridiales bacterium]|nr:discoidin domain-containing protein [Clostridiales bacterium]
MVKVTATPNSGYTLKSLVYNDGTNHDILSTKQFPMPAHDVTVTAEFELIKYAVTVNPTTHGTVSVGLVEATVNTPVTVTVNPDSGYGLKSLVYNDGTNHDITTTRSFLMPAHDVTITAVFEELYNITVDGSIAHGTVTPDKAVAFAGDTVNLTVEPEQDYALKELKYNDEFVDISSGTYSFTMPSEHVTITARFSTAHAIHTSTDGHGTITVMDKAAEGVTVSVTVQPATGYELATLTYNDGADHDIFSTKQFVMPDKEVTVSATFSMVDYDVTVGACTHGTIQVDKTTAHYGDTITVSQATADNGYRMGTVYVDGVAIQGTTFEMPAKDVTVTAEFVMIDYDVTVGACTHGTIKVDKATAHFGDTITVSQLTADDGYRMGTVYVDGVAIQGTTFEMPNKNVTVTAEFVLIDYSVTVNTADNGSITADKDTANIGDKIVITVSPAVGYELKSLKWNDGTDSHDVTFANDEYSFIMPAHDVTVTAEFALKNYTVAIGEREHGTVQVDKTTAKYGETVIVTVTPDLGYELEYLYYKHDGSYPKVPYEDGVYSFTMPAYDVEVIATFNLKKYYIKFSPSVSGIISVSPVTATMGQTVYLHVSIAEGYELTSLKWNDGEDHEITLQSGVNDYTFTMPAHDVTLYAEHRAIDYSVTVSTATNGTITVDKTTANIYDTITVTVNPAEGYEIKSLKWNDGEDHDITIVDGVYSFIMPAHDVTVTAEFTEKTYNVGEGYCAHGEVSVDKETAKYGETVTVTVTTDAGYRVDYCYYPIDNGEVALVYDQQTGVYTFTMPAHNVTVYAYLVAVPYTVAAAEDIENGSLSFDKNKATVEDIVTVIVTPDKGYKLVSLSYDYGEGDKSIGIDGNLTFVMPAHDVTVKAVFGKIDYTLTVSSGANGNIEIDGALRTAQMGDEIAFTVTANDGYGATAVRITYTDGEVVTVYLRETCTFTMPAADVTITADFKAITHITSAEQFMAMAQALDGYYVLDKDIMFEGYKSPIGTAPLRAATSPSEFPDSRGFTFDKAGTAQEGKPFTGVFDGQGYVLIGMKIMSDSIGADNYYRGLFGYIGESGIVKNFTLRDANMSAAKESAFVAGVNLGLIKNVVVEDNSSIYVRYGSIGAIAAYNGGEISSTVCYVGKATTTWGEAVLKPEEGEYSPAYETVNGVVSAAYLLPDSDIHEELGDGWFYHELVGTVYGNDTYAKFIRIDFISGAEAAVYGETFSITIYRKDADLPVSFYAWGLKEGNDVPFKYVGYIADTYTYYEQLNPAVNYTTVETISFGINVGGRYICPSISITVGPRVTMKDFGEFSSGSNYPGTDPKKIVNLFDGDSTTGTAFSGDDRKVGGYLELDLKREINLEMLRITLGRLSNEKTLINTFDGYVQIATNNESDDNFTTIGSFLEGDREFVVSFMPDEITTVRYIRIVLQRFPGWTALSDIYINDIGDYDLPYVTSNNMGNPEQGGPYKGSARTVAAGDRDESTYTSFNSNRAGGQDGGYVQYDFMRMVNITALRAVIGRDDGKGGFSDQFAGYISYSDNGKDFITICEFKEGDRNVVMAYNPGEYITARYIRIVMATVPGHWTAVTDLFINDIGDYGLPYVTISDIGTPTKPDDGTYNDPTNPAAAGDRDESTYITLKKDDTMKANGYVQYNFMKVVTVKSIRAVLGRINKNGELVNTFAGHVSYSVDGREFTPIGSFAGTDRNFMRVFYPSEYIDAQYIRIVMDAVPNGWAAVTDLFINDFGDSNFLGAIDLSGLHNNAKSLSGDGMITQGTKPEYACDGNPDTLLYLDKPDVNSYFEFKFVKPTDISVMRLLTNGNDYFTGKVEYTTDGEKYQELCKITEHNYGADYHFYSSKPRMGVIGLRFTAADWDRSNWLQIREIYINSLADITALAENTDFGALAGDSNYEYMLDGKDDTCAEFDTPEAAGGTLLIDLLSVKQFSNIAILTGKTATDEGSAVIGKIQISTNGEDFVDKGTLTGNYTFIDFGEPTDVRFIRFVNEGGTATAIREIKTNVMNKYVASVDYSKLKSGGMGIHQGSVENMFDNQEGTNIWFNGEGAKDGYMDILLNDEMLISGINVLSGKSSTDTDIFEGKIQYSSDGKSWNDVDGGAVKGDLTLTLETPIRAKYIRLLVTGSTGCWLAFREIQFNKTA